MPPTTQTKQTEERKPALWILNHYAVSPDLPGGTRHYDLARHLVAMGYDVTIIASSFHHMSRREMRLAAGETWKLEEVSGVKFLWLRTTPYASNNWRRVANMLTYMLRSYRIGKRLPRLDPRVPRPDVIIGSTVHLLAVTSAYRLAKHFKAHFLMEVRDLWPQTPVEMGKLSKRSPLTWGLRALETFLYRRAERIITLLPNAGMYIASLGIPQDKITWVPNGVEVSNYEDVPSYDGGGTERPFTLLYLGGQAPYHGLETVIAAAHILQQEGQIDLRFLFVGDGPMNARLRQQALEAGLTNVEFRPPVPKTQVPSVLGEADAMVFSFRDLPVFRYGISPLKLFDYLASRRPILYSVRDTDNMVERANAGITVQPDNPQAMAQGVRELMALSSTQRVQLGKNGLAYVRANHDVSMLAKRLSQAIESAQQPERSHL